MFEKYSKLHDQRLLLLFFKQLLVPQIFLILICALFELLLLFFLLFFLLFEATGLFARLSVVAIVGVLQKLVWANSGWEPELSWLDGPLDDVSLAHDVLRICIPWRVKLV
jgi:hypothetical protein